MLLTRSPLVPTPKGGSSFDLHVLSTPPAFVLSQDQTLRECFLGGPRRTGGRNYPEVDLAIAPSGLVLGAVPKESVC